MSHAHAEPHRHHGPAAFGTTATTTRDSRDALSLATAPVVVHRNARVAAGLGALSGAMGVAYLGRALSDGAWFDWSLAVVMTSIGASYLIALLDARTPLLVTDRQGVRIRLGRSWRGITWAEVDHLEHLPRRGPLHDGRLSVVTRNPEAILRHLGPWARCQSAFARVLYGSPLAVRLGLATLVSGADDDLTAALSGLAGDATLVREVAEHQPGLPVVSSALVASAPLVARERWTPWRALRASWQVNRRSARWRVGSRGWTTERRVWIGSRARLGNPTRHERPSAPVIGPELAAARLSLELSVEQLAVRSRIPAHVIAAMERDDFVPCGGDFFARGHLRTLARVLNLDVHRLLQEYRNRYADTRIDPRRVYQAELANAGSARFPAADRRRTWSLVVGAVVVVALLGSAARLVMVTVSNEAVPGPIATGAAASGAGHRGVPVVLTAPQGGAHVVVRNGAGDIAFTGDLAFGETRTVGRVAPPVRVQSSDGSVQVAISGVDQGALGALGASAQRVFTVSPDR